MHGEDQFFNLESDPHELTDLARDPQHRGEVAAWRDRLIAHLAPRGEEWVSNGRLALRARSRQY